MDKIEKAARKAYETADAACAKRVPWDVLSEQWKTYWRSIAKVVLES